MRFWCAVIGCVLAMFGALGQGRDRPSLDRVALFDRWDINQDGRLDRSELPRPQWFPRLDRNGDGVISREELMDEGPGGKSSGKREGPFARAADYLESCNGHALLVYHYDELIYEAYLNGWSAEKPHRLASGTKSFSGVMAVAAAQDRLLTLDEKVSDTIMEWRGDSRKSGITIRQLLTLTSGLHGGEIGSVPGYSNAVSQAEMRFDPGRRFQYGPVPFQVFGELMRRKLKPDGRSVEGYLRARVLDPIGMKTALWRRDEGGNIRLPSGVMITAREWAKFGLFILHEGEWNGRSILPKEAIRGCMKGTRANPDYGLTFWRGGRELGLKDLAMAAGAGKQKLFMVPSKGLLVVQFAEATRSYQEVELLKRVLKDLPAVTSARAAGAANDR